MDKTKVAAAIIGVLAGLMGASHGPGEILQGNVAPKGIMIMAWPQLTSSPLAGEPAVTVMPSFVMAGIFTIIVAGIVVAWSGTCLERKQGGLLLILLSLTMLAIGGGVVPPLFGSAAGTIAAIMDCDSGKRGVVAHD
jgi:hypothetical protein